MLFSSMNKGFLSRHVWLPLPTKRETRRQAFRAWLLGLSIATPTIAVIQGIIMLSDFRKDHRFAPYPVMPCSGVVVVDPSQRIKESLWYFLRLQRQKHPEPLRLLVMGDSLAAGVGLSKSGSPILPDAIAKELSRASGGRAVHWTCTGTPGMSSPQIVRELVFVDNEEHEEDPPPDFESEQEPLEAPRAPVDLSAELTDWWQNRHSKILQQKWKEEKITWERDEEDEKPKRFTLAWWKDLPPRVQKDVQKVRERMKVKVDVTRDVVEKDWKKLRTILNWANIRTAVSSKGEAELATYKMVQRGAKPLRQRIFEPVKFGQFDVIVIVTGINDLKYIFMPDSDASSMPVTLGDAEEIPPNLVGLKRELHMLVHALRKRMAAPLSQDDIKHRSFLRGLQTGHGRTLVDAVARQPRHSPLIVFPAAPVVAKGATPLNWFLHPFIRLMEFNKLLLAEKNKGAILFVDAPPQGLMSDFEQKRGSIWEAGLREKVLLKLTDLRLHGRERVEKVMKDYYKEWSHDVVDEDPLLLYEDFGPDLVGPYHRHQISNFDRIDAGFARRIGGSTFVSKDKLHPSDEGYEVWGRHIAVEIIKEWERSSNADNS